MQNFEVGQTVRTIPNEDGEFLVGTVEGFILDYVQICQPGAENTDVFPLHLLEHYNIV